MPTIGALFLIGFLLYLIDINNTITTKTKIITESIQLEKARIEDSISTKKSLGINYQDFQLLAQMKKLVIIDNVESWTPNYSTKSKSIQKRILSSGDIAKAYLFIKVSLPDGPFTSWESIYIKMNNKGGHIFRPNSLKIPDNASVDTVNGKVFTTLLFKLNDIPYLAKRPYSETRTPLYIDWLSYFEKEKTITIDAFISSLRKAYIDEISIYYEGVNRNDECLKVVE